MFGKNKMGFKNKPRSLEEINKDYNYHAAQAGHKSRVVSEIQGEIEHHIQTMLNLNEESKKVPKDPVVPTDAPTKGDAA